MADVILKGADGEENTYSGVKTVVLNTTDGGTQIYSEGVAIEITDDTPIELNFSEGNQTIYAPEGTLVKSAVIKKPDDLVSENIVKGKEIAGVEGSATSFSGEVDILSQTIIAEADFFKYEGFPNEERSVYSAIISPATFTIVAGEKYYVEWDGEIYHCTGIEANVFGLNHVYLGDGSPMEYPSYDEPFAVIYTIEHNEIQFMAFEDEIATSHTIRIYQNTKESAYTDERVKGVTFLCGNRELEKYPVVIGDTVKDPVKEGLMGERIETPTKKPSGQYEYVFEGWSLANDNVVDENALVNVTEDREVYAAFSGSLIAFETASWAKVVEKAANGTAATTWAIGDTRDLTLNYADGTSETVTVKIASLGGRCATEDGGTDNITIVLAQPLQKLIPFTTGSLPYLSGGRLLTEGEYNAFNFVTFLRETVLPALPQELQEAIKARSIAPVSGVTWYHKVWGIGASDLFSWGTFKEVFGANKDLIMTPRGSTEAVNWYVRDMYIRNAAPYPRAINTSGTWYTSGSYQYMNKAGYEADNGVVFGFCL